MKRSAPTGSAAVEQGSPAGSAAVSIPFAAMSLQQRLELAAEKAVESAAVARTLAFELETGHTPDLVELRQAMAHQVHITANTLSNMPLSASREDYFDYLTESNTIMHEAAAARVRHDAPPVTRTKRTLLRGVSDCVAMPEPTPSPMRHRWISGTGWVPDWAASGLGQDGYEDGY